MTPGSSAGRGIILVINAGSSSFKFSVFRVGGTNAIENLARGQIAGLDGRPKLTAKNSAEQMLAQREFDENEIKDAKAAVEVVDSWFREQFRDETVTAVGHRVVHGGSTHAQPVLLDDAIFSELEQLVPLAPLHQPYSLEAIAAVRERYPGLPQVLCFDTAFHRAHPQLADLYALPWPFYEAGVRRYGLHGLSYEYISTVLPDLQPGLEKARVIVAHLGNGASLCAMKAGQSLDSTMGFSALDGVPMGTRPGSLDPGVLLYLMSQRKMSPRDLEKLLYHESGLLGLSGISSDMRTLLKSIEPRARIAVDYFSYHVAREIGALTAVLDGLDALIFTAGIGENSTEIRERILERCAWLGITIDREANTKGSRQISASNSKVSAWVVPTNEELMIARHTLRLVTS
jgi:acetate kinase